MIKGKGHMKEKTNGAAEKTEMNIGDTFVAPKGSYLNTLFFSVEWEFREFF